ncbi:MAG: DUF86 domain-containing protein [Thermoanaerobaculia bacterium]|jgi:uncharacterized protein with HEPN domain|nr:DUF86 domain-containing protein [Thermoanaerobaculia bacterium]MBP9823658.1 DUF86 domain-containing protein [Thermoanaerobaculia bacterium]
MQHDDLVYVGQMYDLGRKIESRLLQLDRAGFDADEDVRLALTHLIQTLGEAARRVSQAFRSVHRDIPWSEIIGMRHKIVHDYLSVNFDLVWDVSRHEIPRLLLQLHPLVTNPESR